MLVAALQRATKATFNPSVDAPRFSGKRVAALRGGQDWRAGQEDGAAQQRDEVRTTRLPYRAYGIMILRHTTLSPPIIED
jgi:hypothetical protein